MVGQCADQDVDTGVFTIPVRYWLLVRHITNTNHGSPSLNLNHIGHSLASQRGCIATSRAKG